MTDHAVIVVHGIGEQKPGETVDAVTGAALAASDQRAEWTASDRVFLDKATDGEPPSAPDAGKPSDDRADESDFDLFPVHIRQVASQDEPDRRTLFAEVHWADLSPAPRGAFWTIIDLLRMILGLGYLAMDNAENTRKPVWYGPVALTHLFTWAFFGGVAPVNAVLLIGATILMLDVALFDMSAPLAQSAVVVATGVVSCVVGVLFVRRATTFFVRVFGRGLAIVGFGAALFGFALAVGFLQPGVLCDRCVTHDVIDEFITGMLALLQLAWVAAVTICLILYAMSFKGPKTMDPDDKVGGVRQIYPAICAAMIVLWMVFTSSFWLLFRNIVKSASGAVESSGANHAHVQKGLLHDALAEKLDPALGSLFVTTIGLCFLLVAAFFVMRRSGVGNPPNRIIFAPAFSRVLGLTAAAVLALIVVVWHAGKANADGCLSGEGPFANAYLEAFCQHLDVANGLAAGLLLLLALLIYNFSSFVSQGLGVVRDVVSYAIMGHCMWDVEKDAREANFPLRARIENRFKRVVDYVLETEPGLRKLTIISHSQGTVVATRVLRLRLRDKLNQPDQPEVALFTMGSPVTHIYRRYFPEHFPTPDRLGYAKGRLSWANIYRTDDFVGTRIDEEATGAPVLDDQKATSARGHTGYFVDRAVWAKLKECGFKLFPDPSLPQTGK